MKISKIKTMLLLLFCFSSFLSAQTEFKPIQAFTEEVNTKIEQFLITASNEKGRKVAVFDGDGTVLGQAPHYLADECLYIYAKEHPAYKSDLIDVMRKQSNVSIPYVQNRIKFLSGFTLEEVRKMGEDCFNKYYPGKIFQPMRELIENLKENGFEIWIVSASPEALYQQFLSKAFAIPITHIIGVKSVVRNGIVTDETIHPIPQDEGKMETIETFIQEKPLFVAGNSRGDREMIEFSRGMKFIVNPDEHIETGQTESVADYAKRNNWIVVRIKDVPAENFPWVSSKEFGVRINKTNDVK